MRRAAERREKAARLRAAGLTWRAIADRLGYASPGAACTDVRHGGRRAQRWSPLTDTRATRRLDGSVRPGTRGAG